jgi:hypothetical protein
VALPELLLRLSVAETQRLPAIEAEVVAFVSSLPTRRGNEGGGGEGAERVEGEMTPVPAAPLDFPHTLTGEETCIISVDSLSQSTLEISLRGSRHCCHPLFIAYCFGFK